MAKFMGMVNCPYDPFPLVERIKYGIEKAGFGGKRFGPHMNQRSTRAHNSSATIADVAKESGFSPMTVSRVINGEKNVKHSTRTAVLSAVKKLNYSPNLAARMLAGADQIRIGMLYSNPSAAYLSRLLVGSLEQARLNHVQLVIEDCANDGDAQNAIRHLIANNVDGIIMSPPLCDSDEVLEMLGREKIAAVIVANWRPPGDISVIRIDDVGAAKKMTQHIISLGHRRIGFIKGDPSHRASHQRFDGFKSALAEAGMDLDPALVVGGSFTYRSGLEAAEKLLNLPNPPSAIFASNDDMAAAAITVAHRRHMDVPDKLTVCGFDDTDFAQSIWPELTTIHQPIANMAREAVNMLVEHIRSQRAGRTPPVADKVMNFTFMHRESDAFYKLT
jgi:LacI family transcriptional regulator